MIQILYYYWGMRAAKRVSIGKFQIMKFSIKTGSVSRFLFLDSAALGGVPQGIFSCPCGAIHLIVRVSKINFYRN